MPSELKFDGTSHPVNWSGEDMTVEKGSKVRIRIVGTRVDVNEIVCCRLLHCRVGHKTDLVSQYAIGTMKEDYLGAIDS